MIEEDYLKNRVEEQIKWYDSKSKQNKTCYNGLRGIEIVLAASIPVLTGVITCYSNFTSKIFNVRFIRNTNSICISSSKVRSII